MALPKHLQKFPYGTMSGSSHTVAGKEKKKEEDAGNFDGIEGSISDKFFLNKLRNKVIYRA